jgi:hypothetical protein
MQRRAVLILPVAALVAGCGFTESRLNPFNWFGGGEEEVATFVPPDPVEADTRPLIAEVTALSIERTPGGAIVRATGLPPTQGFWGAGLLVENRGVADDGGTLTYQFRVLPPEDPASASTRQSREIVVGLFLTNQALEGVRAIRVVAEGNARVARR